MIESSNLEEISLGVGFADSELESYVYLKDDDKVVVKIRAWDNSFLEIVFFDPILFIDRSCEAISQFGRKKAPNSTLIEALKKNYETIPANHPYLLFQFLDLDDEPCIEIVSTSYQIKNYPSDKIDEL